MKIMMMVWLTIMMTMMEITSEKEKEKGINFERRREELLRAD